MCKYPEQRVKNKDIKFDMTKLGKTKNIKTQVGRSFLTITIGNQFHSGKRKMFFIWDMK